MSEDFLLPGRWQVCVYTSTGQEEGWNGNFHRHVSKNRTCIKKNKLLSCVENKNSWLNSRVEWQRPTSASSESVSWFVVYAQIKTSVIGRAARTLSKGRNDGNAPHVTSPDTPLCLRRSSDGGPERPLCVRLCTLALGDVKGWCRCFQCASGNSLGSMSNIRISKWAKKSSLPVTKALACILCLRFCVHGNRLHSGTYSAEAINICVKIWTSLIHLAARESLLCSRRAIICFMLLNVAGIHSQQSICFQITLNIT